MQEVPERLVLERGPEAVGGLFGFDDGVQDLPPGTASSGAIVDKCERRAIHASATHKHHARSWGLLECVIDMSTEKLQLAPQGIGGEVSVVFERDAHVSCLLRQPSWTAFREAMGDDDEARLQLLAQRGVELQRLLAGDEELKVVVHAQHPCHHEPRLGWPLSCRAGDILLGQLLACEVLASRWCHCFLLCDFCLMRCLQPCVIVRHDPVVDGARGLLLLLVSFEANRIVLLLKLKLEEKRCVFFQVTCGSEDDECT